MVAKVENNRPRFVVPRSFVERLLMDYFSTWLAKTSGRQSRFSRWVLVLAVFLVLVRITYLVVAVVR